MLGMLIPTAVPCTPNAWKIWVDHIIKQKKKFGFKKAAIAHENGMTTSASPGLILPIPEIQNFQKYFDVPEKAPESIRLQGKTYVVKSIDEHIMVAFSGSKYFIISKSKAMYIITYNESKSKVEEAATWLRKINNRLIEKDF